MKDVLIVLPLLLVLGCFMFLTNHYRRLWERGLERERRLGEMISELTGRSPPAKPPS